MKRFKHLSRRRKQFLAVIALVFVVACVSAGKKLAELRDELMVDNYASYLKCVYLPEQRHLTGKWPSDLSGLPQFVKNEKTMSADQNLDDFILRFHADNYEGFEPVKIQKDGGNEIYTFNIRLKGRKKKFQWMATN